TYNSADTVFDDADARPFPVELLNSLTPPGMPPHRLRLKLGTPVILLRNLNASGGQADGTRVIVSVTHRTFVECDITTGTDAGRRVYVPRIRVTAADSDLPFTLRRRQLPLNVACSLTINKAQGQTLAAVDLYLHTQVFTHGQAYVAFSRVSEPAALTVALPNHYRAPEGNYFDNIVYEDILRK
ncbi:unnamed protein product, partial [Phaeothamnion confervicola]